jgi:hypothetical protein
VTTTTLDPPSSVLLTIKRDGRHYIVRYHIGTRYGHSSNPLMALIGWWWQVQDLLDLDEPTGEPLTSEIRFYKQALGEESR